MVFLLLLSHDGFESDSPETKFQTIITSEAAVRRCFLKQVFRKSFTTEQHLRWSLLLMKLQVSPKQAYSCEYSKFLTTAFFEEHLP